jgi:hypothetical protein
MKNTKEYFQILEIAYEEINTNIDDYDDENVIKKIKIFIKNNAKSKIHILKNKLCQKKHPKNNLFQHLDYNGSSMMPIIDLKNGEEMMKTPKHSSLNEIILKNEINFSKILFNNISLLFIKTLENIKDNIDNFKLLFDKKEDRNQNGKPPDKLEDLLKNIKEGSFIYNSSKSFLFEFNKIPKIDFFQITNYYTIDSLKEKYFHYFFCMCENEGKINILKNRKRIIDLIAQSDEFELKDFCLKNGISHCLRINVYKFLLNIDIYSANNGYHNTNKIKKKSKENYNQEIYEKEYKLISQKEDYYLDSIESLVNYDLKKVEGNSFYFLFFDQIKKFVFSLLNDKNTILYTNANQPVIYDNIETKDLETYHFIRIYDGFTYLPSPFTYFSTNEHDNCSIFKRFFSNYLIFLDSYSSLNPNSLLHLIYSFNIELEKYFPEVSTHNKLYNLNFNEIIVSSFQTAFITILPVKSILYLFDFILLTEKLDIFLLLMLSLIQFYKKELLLIQTQEELLNFFQIIKYDDCHISKIIINFLELV